MCVYISRQRRTDKQTDSLSRRDRETERHTRTHTNSQKYNYIRINSGGRIIDMYSKNYLNVRVEIVPSKPGLPFNNLC